MALRDEIKAGRKDLMENGTWKQKVAYFFDYYGLRTVAIIMALVFIISFIYQQLTKPDVILNGIVLNVIKIDNGDPVQDLTDGFIEYIGMDTKEYGISINSSLTLNMSSDSKENPLNNYDTEQAMMAQCAAETVDFISCPLNAIIDYGYGDLIVDLREVLKEEDLAKYEPYFLYVDGVVAKHIQEANDNLEDTSKFSYPDPKKPEEMEDPIPVFIDVTRCEKMANIYSYSTDTLAVAVAANVPNPERVSDFLAYLFKE